MFDKINQAKKLFQMKQKFDAIKKVLAQEHVTVHEGDVMVVVSGDQRVQKIVLDGQERKDIATALNKAIEESQKVAAKKMQEMGGGLEGLLGGM